ncbi:hypothetical protein EJ02DRAFT_220840 [Clathrospora elynae]|uniref:Uncharacterized protein n=1 Tax=Clathrospora elynae TaxID=706981 RepID=A0A6A5SMA5_9PLEO|nr:hypothetical protein EJ02DRAFT_220840 [Clathrospora elynae]
MRIGATQFGRNLDVAVANISPYTTTDCTAHVSNGHVLIRGVDCSGKSMDTKRPIGSPVLLEPRMAIATAQQASTRSSVDWDSFLIPRDDLSCQLPEKAVCSKKCLFRRPFRGRKTDRCYYFLFPFRGTKTHQQRVSTPDSTRRRQNLTCCHKKQF